MIWEGKQGAPNVVAAVSNGDSHEGDGFGDDDAARLGRHR
jgi:hypothetical protein